MKREIPILLTIVCGLLITLAFFARSGSPPGDPEAGPPWTQAANAELLEWALVFFSVAFLLGIANLVRISLKTISARGKDWQYKIVLLLSLFGFLAVGLAEIHTDFEWAPLRTPRWVMGETFLPPDRITLRDGTEIEGWIVDRQEEVTIVTSPDKGEVVVEQAQIDVITDRSFKLWIYHRVFIPLQATMFSLLAFYIASAAFRAFRARSMEATLLLLAGTVVMLGSVELGGTLGRVFGEAQAFLMAYINAAGQKAIIIGATLGILATGLRIVLGLERSYLSE